MNRRAFIAAISGAAAARAVPTPPPLVQAGDTIMVILTAGVDVQRGRIEIEISHFQEWRTQEVAATAQALAISPLTLEAHLNSVRYR